MRLKGILLVAVALAAVSSFAQQQNPKIHQILGRRWQHMNQIVPGKLLVKFDAAEADTLGRNPSSIPSALLQSSARYQGRLFETGWTIWTIPAIDNPKEVAASLIGTPGIVSAQPVNEVYALSLPTPNDGDYATQEDDPNLILGLDGDPGTFRRLWHFDDTDAEAAWNIYPGQWYTQSNKPTNAPLIAVVDSGCDMHHPDFANSAFGTGGSTDSDQGGQLLFRLSTFFSNGQPDFSETPDDLNGHGTHVTGIALAAGNNGTYAMDTENRHTGTIGMGYNSRGMILRVFADDGTGTDLDAAAAIFYAADNGADVVNLSLGTTNFSQLFQDAVTYAFQKGTLVVCAGNENGSGGGDLGPIYPAACSGALGVAANGPGLASADGNYAGSGYYVDVAAPGGDVFIAPDLSSYTIQEVWSTSCRNDCQLSEDPNIFPPYTLNYTYLLGTSMACPMVSGSAGLYYGYHHLHQADGYVNIRAYRAIEKGAIGVSGVPQGGWEPVQGYGCLDTAETLIDDDARGAAIGGIEGIVYFNATVVNGVSVSAQKTSGGTTFHTTTHPDGTFRFDGMPAGTYLVSASPFGAPKSKKTIVKLGSDSPGVDLWAGTFTGDSTAPVVPKFDLNGPANTTDITVKHFGYDTETSIDKIVFRIGTTSGGQNVMADKEIVPDTNLVKLTGLSLSPGVTYFLKGTYTNGAGLNTVKTKTFTVTAGSDGAAFVSQSVPSAMNEGGTYPVTVTFNNTGSSTWTLNGGYEIGSQNPQSNNNWGRLTVTLGAADSIAPGSSKAFSFNVTAPPAAGDYNFQWGMRTVSAFFGPFSTNVVVHVAAVGDFAKFVSQVVPTSVQAGTNFNASMTMQNTGTNAWTDAAGYRLASVNPSNNSTFGTNRVFLGSSTVAAGATFTFTKTFKAPTTPGTYVFQWKMLHNGPGTFGQNTRAVSIVVTP